MSKDDWRTVGYIGIALGVVFLIGGFITYCYKQDIYIYGNFASTVYPYRDYSVGLFVASIALDVIGGGALWRAGIEAEKSRYVMEPAIPSTRPRAGGKLRRRVLARAFVEGLTVGLMCGVLLMVGVLEFSSSSIVVGDTFPRGDYVDLINQLKADGYRFEVGLGNLSGNVCFLVHSGDYSFNGERTFVSVEESESVRSTFLVRPDSTFFPQTIGTFLQLQDGGWSLGYEYDCLSRADGNMSLACLMFQSQVVYLKDLGMRLWLADEHGDAEYNLNINSYQIYLQHPELFVEDGLVPVLNFTSNFHYFSDSSFHRVVLSANLSGVVVLELHTDWW